MRSVRFTAHNRITLLHSGAEYFPALIRAINEAREEVLLETYIFAPDETGEEVKAALKKAAARGVNVNVITDWLGTGHKQCMQLRQEFREAGVHYRVFNSWFQRGIVRTHRKICVVDRQIAFLGGLNINHDLRADDNPSVLLPAPRWDFAVSIVGPLVEHIHLEVEAQWMLLNRFNLRYRWEKFRGKFSSLPAPPNAPMLAALVVRDNLRNRRTIQKAYMKALGGARESAMLVTPYFAPGGKLRRALAQAAMRGVNVTLLLGVGEFRIQDAVAHSFYPKLLKAGVKIVEYTRTQLHGKVGVIDNHWATVGSSNWDGLSLLLNQEANVVINDRQFTRELRAHIEHGIADGTPVRLEDYINKPWYKRMMYGAAYLFYRTVLRVIAADRFEE
jgi:cardiolipin synthase A/B